MNNFIVSALKYRPATFDTVVGQQSITKTLKNAIKTNHLAHAYLFFGPRGVGKTTCARIFAKTINCDNLTSEQEACNVCESCVSFSESRSYNIHELDAASNNSVDDIRNLTEQVRIPPQIGSYSIYIIDEVHMLSTQAFNAFLKTLEEPPKHAIFILATTEKHKIIPTILSRCQIFDFNRIKIDDTIGHLQNVAEKENISAEIEGLNIIAQKADGAMRDALSIFDQIVSSSGSSITYANVIENLNVLDYEYFFKLTDLFLEGNIWQSLVLFDEILNKGFDSHNFVNSLSKHFRDILICKDQQAIQLLEVGPSIRQQYSIQVGKTSLNFLVKALEIVNNCDLKFKESKNKRLHVEIAIISLCNISGKLIEKEPVEKIPEAIKKSDDAPKKVHTNTKREVQNSIEVKKTENAPSINVEKPTIKKISSIKNIAQSLEIKESNQKIDSINGQNSNVEESTISYKTNTQSEKFSASKLIEAWSSYATKFCSTKPRLFNILNSNKPELLDNFVLKLKLENQSQESSIRTIQLELLKFLSAELKNSKITLEVEVTQNTDNNRPYTNSEKLSYLADKNPLLKRFSDELSLDFQ